MSTWKKVALAEDIGVFAGGTSTSELGGNQHDVLVVGTGGDISHFNPGTSKFIVGNSDGQLDNFGVAADSAVTITFDSSADDLTLALAANAVTTTSITDSSINLDKLADAAFDSGSDMTGALLYWDGSDAADILEAGSNGQVLTLAGGVPTWATAGSATNVDINNGGSATNADFGIVFASEAGIGGLTADKAYVDGTTGAYKVSYNPTIHSVSHTAFTSGKYNSDVVGDNNDAAFYSQYGFAGDLAGTATSAKGVETTAVTTGTYYAPLLYQSTGATHGAQVGVNSGVSYTVNGAGDVDMKISGNLIINGDSTILEVEASQVNIADFRMKLAHTDGDDSANNQAVNLNGDQIQTAAGALGVGMLIDNAAVSTEANLARFSYRGHKSNSNFTNSKSVMGWTMAQEANSAANSAATEVGVAAMHVDDGYAMTTAGGTSNKNFNKGAMAWFGTGANGGLWIQTA